MNVRTRNRLALLGLLVVALVHAVALASVVGCSGRPPVVAPPQPVVGPDRNGAAEAVAWIAETREDAGLAPLAPDERLGIMARDHAVAMANAGKAEHDLPGRPIFRERLRRSGYRGGGGEVVTTAYTAAGAVGQWLRSTKGHKEIILSPRGKAIGSGQAGMYWCVVIGY